MVTPEMSRWTWYGYINGNHLLCGFPFLVEKTKVILQVLELFFG